MHIIKRQFIPNLFKIIFNYRFRRELQNAAKMLGKKVDVVIAGLSNMYTSYVTTPEEYQVI